MYPILLSLSLPYAGNGKLDSQIKNKDICIKSGIAIGTILMVYFKNFTLHMLVPVVYGCRNRVLASMAVSWGIYIVKNSCYLLTWNIYIRKEWGVPSSTHRRFVTPLSGFSNRRTVKCESFLHFFRTCINRNHNRLLSAISRLVCHNVNANTGRNITSINLKTNNYPFMFEQICNSNTARCKRMKYIKYI